MKIEHKLLGALALIAGASMTGCSPGEINDAKPGKTGLPNPAAVYCIEKGGTYEIRGADDGSEIGICILADGTEINAWAFFRDQ